MIFLTNEQIEQVLDMKTCMDAMEDAYRELNELIRQQRLHRRRAAFQRQILAIEPVLLKDSLLLRRPSHGMNRR